MANVKVDMQICDKTHDVTVTLRDDGKFDVTVVTDCEHIEQYSERIRDVTMDDISNMDGSAVVSYGNTMMMCATCLVPKGILYAAWIEAGMISKNLARDSGVNTVSFVPDGK